MRKDFLRLIQLRALPLIHFINLFKRKEGHHAKELQNIGVIHISPVLVEIVRGGLIRIEPYRTAGGLSHLGSVMLQKKRDRHRIGILLQLLADQIGSAEHVRPLIISAELHLAAVILVQAVEIIALHQHVGKLKERESALHAVHVATCTEHFVDVKLRTDVAHELKEIEITQPVCVVDHLCLAGSEIDKTAHLFLKAVTVVINLLDRHHLTHVASSGRISDHRGSAAYKSDRLVASLLHALHQQKCHKMSDMKGVRSRVKANIKRRLSIIDQLRDFLLIGQLCEQSSCLQFL